MRKGCGKHNKMYIKTWQNTHTAAPGEITNVCYKVVGGYTRCYTHISVLFGLTLYKSILYCSVLVCLTKFEWCNVFRVNKQGEC